MQTTSSIPPRLAFSSAPHAQDPTNTIAVWFTDPPGAFMQFLRPATGTVPLVQWLLGPAREQVFARFPAERLTFVMDLTLMTTRDPDVRPLMIEAGKEHKARIERSIWIPPHNATAVYRASLMVAASLMNVFGVPVEIHSSTAFTLRALRLQAAPP